MSASRYLKWLLDVKLRQYSLADENLSSVVTSFLSICDLCGGHLESGDDDIRNNEGGCERCLSHYFNCPQLRKCNYCNEEVCVDCCHMCSCGQQFCQICHEKHEVRCRGCNKIVCVRGIKTCNNCRVKFCRYCHHYIKCDGCGVNICRRDVLVCSNCYQDLCHNCLEYCDYCETDMCKNGCHYVQCDKCGHDTCGEDICEHCIVPPMKRCKVDLKE